jgi:hypothetical protein
MAAVTTAHVARLQLHGARTDVLEDLSPASPRGFLCGAAGNNGATLLPNPGHTPERGLGHRPVDNGCLRG